MAITTAVTRKLDNNCVQVEVKARKDDVRYYKVPEQKADSFQKEYVANSKKMSRLSNLMFFLSFPVTIGFSYLFTKKIESQSLRTVIGVCAGIIGGIGTAYAGANMTAKNHTEFLQKYNSEEIDYSESKLPI